MYVESNIHHVISLQKNIFVMLNVMDLTRYVSVSYILPYVGSITLHEWPNQKKRFLCPLSISLGMHNAADRQLLIVRNTSFSVVLIISRAWYIRYENERIFFS